jgi:glycosyltransferase involved in cell wall biosynthesis
VTAGRLLAVNFRDPAHPEAGGAELHLEWILRAAVRRGFEVTWLASGFRGGAPEAMHEGMRIARRGDWWNFNLVLGSVLRNEFSSPAPDLVVEDINKVPCFTPWWTRSPVAVIVPHLFGATAFQEAGALLGAYVVALESLIPAVYRGRRFVVISESTRDDLVRRGIPAESIEVVHCGLDHALYRPDPAVAKSPRPTIVFVGRLRRYKGLDWVMRALPDVVAKVPETRLVVLGDGPFRAALEREASRLSVSAAVEFRGFVSAEEKVRSMREAWVLVQPSPKEGWGLTVVEAGACGTAVIASDAPGLRDSVKGGETGILVSYGDRARLAETLVRVLTDSALRERLGREGIRWASRFRWEDCGERSLDALLPREVGS